MSNLKAANLSICFSLFHDPINNFKQKEEIGIFISNHPLWICTITTDTDFSNFLVVKRLKTSVHSHIYLER